LPPLPFDAHIPHGAIGREALNDGLIRQRVLEAVNEDYVDTPTEARHRISVAAPLVDAAAHK
jgi:hypothetical protein